VPLTARNLDPSSCECTACDERRLVSDSSDSSGCLATSASMSDTAAMISFATSPLCPLVASSKSWYLRAIKSW
jgi:hypothetical protein